MSRLPILAKSNILIPRDFWVPKLKKIKGGKILTSPISKNVTSYFYGQWKPFFKISWIFASNRKTPLSGAKNYRQPWSQNFWIQKYFSPKNVQKSDQQPNDQRKKSMSLRNHSLNSSDFMHKVKWQWIPKSDRPKVLKTSPPLCLGPK